MTPPLRKISHIPNLTSLFIRFFVLKKYCPQKHLESKTVTQLVDKKTLCCSKTRTFELVSHCMP
eukprot:UN28136